MAFNLGDILVKWVLPLVETKGKEALYDLLQKLHDTDVKSYTQLVTGVYPLIDVQLEDYAKKTKTTIDDDVVDDLKSTIEKSAKANSVILPNLDDD